MSKRRHGNYPSRPSTSDRHEAEEDRRPYPGWVSGSVRPELEARREYDNRRRYCDGDRETQPVKLSGLSVGLPVSESTAMKFEWNNLLTRKPDGLIPVGNPGRPGSDRPVFGFSNENDAYRVNAENGYGGGSGKSGVSFPDVDISRKYGSFHGGFTSQLGKSHVGISKVDDFGLGECNPYMGPEVKPVFGSRDGFSSGLKEGFGGGLSDEFNKSREMIAGPGFSQGQTPGLNELVDSNWGQHKPNGGWKVTRVKTSENADMGNLPFVDSFYKKMDPLPPSYMRPSNVDTIDSVHGSLSQWNQLHNVVDQTQPTIPNYQSLSSAEQSVTEKSLAGYNEVLASGSRTGGFGFGGDDGLERGREALSYESTLRRLAVLEGDQGLDEMTTVQMCAMRRRALAKRLRLYDEKSELSYGDNQWNDEGIEERFANIGEGLLNINHGEDQWNNNQNVNFGEDQLNINQNVNFGDDQLNINQNVNFGEDQQNIGRDVMYGENQWNIVQDVAYGGDQWNAEDINTLNSDSLLPSSKLPAPMQEHHGEQFKSARVGVKRRLGPLKSPGSIKKRLGPLNSPGIVKKHLEPLESSASVKKCLEPLKSPGSVKKRMGPAQNPPNLDFLGSKLQDQSKSHVRERDDFGGSIHPQGDCLPKVKEKPEKEELPENSEDFNKLVDGAFFKYMKGLHENPALRRKFTKGGTFTTKCCVCASNSKEFSGMVPLATHAFCSKGFRAEHLGFHKALCVLLGWDTAAVSNGTWVQRKLPDAEALAMKEDVVIWPPVVVIHNSSITNKNPDERVILNNQELEVILTGIGFGGGKAKVCRGKPANQSIMVVIFIATFSGFREAAKLHKFFADNKHGRSEFQQISCAALSNSSEGEQNSVADEANFLYGYLGVAEDLDKIDSETKKRCVVKSKKEILAIANACL